MKKQKKYKTGFLFSTPSFLSGFGSVMNLAGNYYLFNYSETGFEADQLALENDFKMIGQDIYDAIENLKSENSKLLLPK